MYERSTLEAYIQSLSRMKYLRVSLLMNTKTRHNECRR